jgi:hypothetical protein
MLFTCVLILELFVTVFANSVIIGFFFPDLKKEFCFGFWFCFVMVLNAKFSVEMLINVVSIVVQHVPVASIYSAFWERDSIFLTKIIFNNVFTNKKHLLPSLIFTFCLG